MHEEAEEASAADVARATTPSRLDDKNIDDVETSTKSPPLPKELVWLILKFWRTDRDP